MKKRLGIIVLLLLFGSVTLSHATLMESTWTATIFDDFTATTTHGENIFIAAGTVFTVTSIYDNAIKSINYWDDGTNGIAEFGAGDDTVAQTFNYTSASIAYADNAEFTLSDSFYDLFDQFIDSTGQNYAFQMQYNGGTKFTHKGDGVTITFLHDYYTAPNGLYIYDNPNDNTFNQVFDVDNISFSTTVYTPPGQGNPVPEPATIILLGSGLIGIAGSMRKFKK